MEEVLDVFGVVEGCRVGGRLAGLFDVSGFSRVDALENAESSEIGQGDLQFANCLSPGDVVLCLARLTFLFLFAHFCV